MNCEEVEIVCIFLAFGYTFLRFFRWMNGNFLKGFYQDPVDFKKFGKWALVTGATDGIGKEYVRSLAERGLNIILVSRTLSKLETVAKEIKQTFKVETAVIDVDFTSGSKIYDKIKEKVKGKEIGVLVNNVGMFYAEPAEFLEIENREKMIQDIVECNINSVPMMCSIVLPQMVNRKKGIVINISSMSALVKCPAMCIYSASKAFVNKFSEDLAAEYESKGIIIQSVMPGPVATNMTKQKNGSFIAPNAKDYVSSAIKTVGFTDSTTGYWFHSVLVFASNAFSFVLPKVYISTQRYMFRFVLSGSIYEKYSRALK